MAKKHKKNAKRKSPVQQPPSLSSLSLSTDTASTDASQPVNSSKCHLLRIPLELRRKIYAFLLDTKCVQEPTARKHNPWASLDTTICRVNKQIYQESSDVFWSYNLFVKLALFSDDPEAASDMFEHVALPLISDNPTRIWPG